MSDADRKLARLRRDIDAVDDAILDLITNRATLVDGIVAAKARAGTLDHYLRPGREAMILRRLAERNAGAFPAGALVRIWRELLCALFPLQGPFSVAVGGRDIALWDTARDFYGSDTVMHALEDGTAAMKALAEGEDQLAVIRLEEHEPWRAMTAGGSGAPRIVGFLPFVDVRPGAGERARAFVLSQHGPEASGEDITVLAFDREPGAALADAGLAVHAMHRRGALWIAEIEGFHEGGHDRCLSCGDLTGMVLGAYPAPLSL